MNKQHPLMRALLSLVLTYSYNFFPTKIYILAQKELIYKL
ncbi:hypothetical protein T190115A13A_80175 [Tenacibaculum sp. 190524A02b]|uniref:Uncharacterized protein n=1 Tax=Tenacibaculum vairaonense TaxID=3137860 RepID=A0ABM9PS09_9FLAO